MLIKGATAQARFNERRKAPGRKFTSRAHSVKAASKHVNVHVSK